MSRALSGLYAVFRPQFHLAAVGFLWNPLPSLLSIPLALLRGIWPPIMDYGFAANIISSSFAAVGAYHFNRLLWRFGLGRTARVLWCLAYATNPLLMLYGGNGMTDGMMSAVVVASVENLVGYMTTDQLSRLVVSASWLAASFMIRYESVPIGAAMGVGLAVSVFRKERSWPKAEGTVVAFWFPVVCAGIVWILLNWMIMHNPLYFASSRYSNAVQLSSGIYNTPAVIAARHNILVSFSEVAHFSLLFWPYIPAVLAVIALQFRRNRGLVGFPILMGSFGAPLLQLVMLYAHRSADWERFFIYYIPFGFMLCGYLISLIPAPRRSFVALLMLPVLLSANLVTLSTMQSPVWGHGDRWVTHTILSNKTAPAGGGPQDIWPAIVAGKGIADYVNAHKNMKILMSSFTSFAVIPYVRNPQQLVFTVDSDFKSILENPRGRVNAILAPPTNAFTKASDTITAMYPNLWAGGVPWTRLIKQFPGGDRLYAVLPNAP